MSATIIVKRKRKRVKVECLECGNTFDDDFKKKHEEKLHDGKRINVKHVGAPKNPFQSAAKTSQLLSKQIKLHNMIPVNFYILNFSFIILVIGHWYLDYAWQKISRVEFFIYSTN